MKTLITCILASLYIVASAEDAKFAGEFTLKAMKHMEGLQLAKEYKLTITGGTATISYTDQGKVREDKGTVALTIHNGVDPATKRFAQFDGFIRVEVTNPGWVRDKFITRFDLPFTAPPTDKAPKATFAAETAVEVLWLDILSDGLTRYSDPMNVRLKSPYSITVTNNPLP